MLIGWAIDEDAISRGGVRREGMHYAANGMVQHLSGVINGLVLVAWGAAGFDAKLCTHQQTRSAVDAIEYSFLVGLPVISLLTGAISLAYPIQGARLERLKQRMGPQSHAQGEPTMEPTPSRTRTEAAARQAPETESSKT